MIVELTSEEMLTAAITGARRRISSLVRGRKDKTGWTKGVDYWGSDVEACGAEMAVAKMFDAYWHGVHADTAMFYEGDVRGWEVRWTKYKNGSLIVSPDDPDERCYILVTGMMPRYDVKGWIAGANAMKKKWLRTPDPDRPPKYWVEQKFLLPFEQEEAEAA